MGVWTKKRGSMKAVVLMAAACPKSLHGKGENGSRALKGVFFFEKINTRSDDQSAGKCGR